MKNRKICDPSGYIFAVLAVLLVFLGGIVATKSAQSQVTTLQPYERLLVTDKAGRIHAVDVIVNLKELVKQHDDDSRILRYVDEDARVVIYMTQNSTGDMFTSMQIVTRGGLSPHSQLFKRMGW